MNILDNIGTVEGYIRSFYIPKEASDIGEYTKIPIQKIYGTDPQYVAYAPFKNGYNISFTLRTCIDLREIASNNLLVDIILKTSDKYIQLGSGEGFRIENIIPPPSYDKTYFVYTFTTNKPNNEPYKIRNYVSKN